METVRPAVLTVGQLNSYIKNVIDGDYKVKNIFLTGEISNFTNHLRTGHFYMTLKDEKSSVKAVMFRSYADRLKFMPENGMKIIAFGSISVFERDGQYQFYIENMQPDGLGSLNMALEQLKERLQKEGLFSPEHKKPLPQYPRTVGVVTSPTGAAFQDIINVLGRRWPQADILISPAQVQGDSAPAQIAEALKRLDSSGLPDTIILARGGGSAIDLWAFNDEKVVRAVYNCKTPVITGVGHETDFTLADFAADFRAPTPSAAAEVAVPDMFAELERISQLDMRSKRALKNGIDTRRARIKQLSDRIAVKSPKSLLNEKRLILDSQIEKLNTYIARTAENERNKLALLAGKLEAYSPLKALSRGYSIVRDDSSDILKSVNGIKQGDVLSVTMSDGYITCTADSVHGDA